MNSKYFFIIMLVLGGAIIFGLSIGPQRRSTNSNPSVLAKDVQSESTSLAPQSKSMGAVEVEVTPAAVNPEGKTVFKLTLNTHSVDLDYDYTNIATLSDNVGNTYKALEWTGELGGHHLQGELIFEPLSDNAQSITLEIDGIDNQSASFTWEL